MAETPAAKTTSKKLNLLIILSFAWMISVSQTNQEKEAIDPIGDSEFSIGSKGGYGHSFLSDCNNCIYNSSWNIGLAMMYSPSDHFAIGLDLGYSSEGAAFKTGDLSQGIQLDYLRLPLKIMYFFRKYEHDLRPKIGVGPSLGILLNKKENGFPLTDAGANALMGFNYRLLGGVWLTVDLGYYYGLNEVYTTHTQTFRNNHVRLDLGIMLGF